MKERLEEISNLLERYYSTDDSFEQTDLAIEIIQGHVDWLLNRIEELEKDNKRLRDLNYHNNLPAMKSMYEENQRYKQALEEIARGRFPGASYKARQALKGE